MIDILKCSKYQHILSAMSYYSSNTCYNMFSVIYLIHGLFSNENVDTNYCVL